MGRARMMRRAFIIKIEMKGRCEKALLRIGSLEKRKDLEINLGGGERL
jgi:hypothetical protein